jgi:uncharacterized protein YabN with tetrapyrrole methylase and pyrophosphatase domain
LSYINPKLAGEVRADRTAPGLCSGQRKGPDIIVVEDALTSTAEPSLFVIGLGVKIPDHTTLEAHQAISACKVIYSIVQEPPHVWMPLGLAREIPVVNLLTMYEENAVRKDNYDRASEAVFSTLHKTEPIGYVTYGNPLTYDSVAQNLLRLAQDHGTRVKVIAGISSIDTLLCDLRVDMAPGIQIYEATWMVAGEIAPRTDLPVILLQLGAFGSLRTHYRAVPLLSSLAGLISHLLHYYPPSHEVCLVRTADQRDFSSKVTRFNLGAIGETINAGVINGSMYVPALQEPRYTEGVLAKLLQA